MHLGTKIVQTRRRVGPNALKLAAAANGPKVGEIGITLYPHQVEAVRWMKERDREGGAILADDMGLGKTMDVIALMCDDPVSTDPVNLILAPPALLFQWKSEFERNVSRIDSRRNILVYHGSDRKQRLERFLVCDLTATITSDGRDGNEEKDETEKKREESGAGEDRRTEQQQQQQQQQQTECGLRVVLTTYDILRNEWTRHISKDSATRRPSPLYQTKWYRIVLDEAHKIRESKGCNFGCAKMLDARRSRWCVTGTPFNNRMSDLYSLADFVCHGRSVSINDACLATFKLWLSVNLLKRTKKDTLDMPPIEYRHIEVEMGETERREYDAIAAVDVDSSGAPRSDRGDDRDRHEKETETRRESDEGSENPLTRTMSLRRSCDHAGLARIRPPSFDRGFFGAKEYHRKRKRFDQKQTKEPSRERQIEKATERKDAGDDRTRVVPNKKNDFYRRERPNKKPRIENLQPVGLDNETKGDETDDVATPCAKLDELIVVLNDAFIQQPDRKVVVFSQWTDALDIIKRRLDRVGMSSMQYDGSIVGLKKRDDIIRTFCDPKNTRFKILLCSLHCAGVGLNLTSANMVVMYDAWYNPALEKQAIDRVYRIGQTQPVTVVRLSVRDSVERDVFRIQRDKINGAAMVLGSANSLESLKTPF